MSRSYTYLKQYKAAMLRMKEERCPSGIKSLEDEVLRLRMENEVLRDFLSPILKTEF